MSYVLAFTSHGAFPRIRRVKYQYTCPRQRYVSFSQICTKSELSLESGTTPILEMQNMTYRIPNNLDVKLFDSMNFHIYPKEFVMIMGHNGAGKTTALKLMTGLERVPRGKGKILWKGEKIRPSRLLRHIGVVMQSPANYFVCPTVLDELIVGRPTKTPDDIRRILTAVGLSNISLMSRPKELSGGQIRRLAIALQLVKEPLPELLILDEPMAGVDWTARYDVVTLLHSLKSQFAIIIISHEPGELLQYADRVVEVRKGDMHNIDPEIITKAIEIRKEMKIEARKKARREALEYAEYRKKQVNFAQTPEISRTFEKSSDEFTK